MNETHHILKRVSLVILFLFSSIIAQDEPNSTKKLRDLTIAELMNVIVISASKSEEEIVDAPSSVIVFTHKEIESMGISSLEELLNFVPGFQTTRDVEQGTATRISARGRSSALSESILFLLNGQRLNDLYTGGASLLNRMIPVENIKQVEIIRGPGSALYGSNAFLGVVNIQTLDDINSFDIKFGTENSREIAANFTQDYGAVKIAGFLKAFRKRDTNTTVLQMSLVMKGELLIQREEWTHI